MCEFPGGLLSGKGSKLISSSDKKLLKAIGSNIREERLRQDLNVFDITGDDMPIKSRQHWQALEAGNKNFNITTLFKIAATLKITPEKLIKT
jgi:transcriptional regulator with XRE-family HTH domain